MKTGALGDIASAVKHLPNHDADYDAWIRVGYAIKNAVGFDDADGLALFHDWSAKSEKYDPEATEKAWDAARPEKIGAGTLFHLAEQAGWTRPRALAAEEFGPLEIDVGEMIAAGAERGRGRRVLTYSDMVAMPEPEWLIEGVIQKRSAAVMFGKSNSFKSFLAIDMALSVATGRVWQGQSVAHGRVLIVATEGANGVGRLRVPGWYDH